MNLQEHPHRRYNPLLDEWILVSPHRTKRPWQGKTEKLPIEHMKEHDPDCYLCPGNKRADGSVNPKYDSTYVFMNDFSALLPDTPKDVYTKSGLLLAESEKGLCKVICFSPRHDLTLSRMEIPDIRKVVETWMREVKEVGSLEYINYVQIFENRGDVMGCSNPHPHGQLWANQSIPLYPLKETDAQREYQKMRRSCLLCDYLETENAMEERIVISNNSFTVVVPFWAVWPYETMIIPKRHQSGIHEMLEQEKTDLADIMRRLGIRYDNLFQTSFPYSMGIHQRPTDGLEHAEWHYHLHYYPPLLRSATVKKFMVGYEMLAMAQRDITAEQSAKKLRELTETHYRKGK